MTDPHQPAEEPRSPYITLQELLTPNTPRAWSGNSWDSPTGPIPTGTSPKRAHHHLYLRSTVEERSAGKDFQALPLTNLLDKVITGDTKLNTITQWAESVPIITSFPDLSWEDITETACWTDGPKGGSISSHTRPMTA